MIRAFNHYSTIIKFEGGSRVIWLAKWLIVWLRDGVVMGSLANLLIISGALILGLALIPVNKLRRRLPVGVCRRSWMFLSMLIAFFFVGYLFYAYLFWNQAHQWCDMVVPAIFFFGSVFVLVVCSLSAKTADDVTRLCHLEHENVTDPLMGIYNRRYMDRCLKQEGEKAKRYGLEFSVMMIDVDFFKKVNDTYGHSVGDQVLQSLAQMIKGSVRDFDRVFRYGGEEIVVLLPYTNCDGAMVLGQRLCEWVSERSLVEHDSNSISVTISVGVSCLCPSVEDVGTMMARADRALYRAKENGRNRVERAAAPQFINDQCDKLTVNA